MSRRDRAAAEDGFALVGAVFAMFVLTGLSVIFVSMALSESKATGVSRDFEHAVHAAEAGADRIVARVNDNASYVTGHPWTLAANATPDEQRAWAVAQFEAARTASPRPASMADVPQGLAMGIRPHDAVSGVPRDEVFGVGEIAGAYGAELRVVKLGFDRGLYTATHALLTGGLLTVSGDSLIDGTAGNVHTNGDLIVPGNTSIIGNATASGDYSVTGHPTVGGVSGGGYPSAPLPRVDVRSLYGQRSNYAGSGATPYDGSWFDLCPDGRVHAPAPTGGDPCTGPALSVAGTRYIGWEPSGEKWQQLDDEAYDGIFYVYQRNVQISGNGGSPGAPVGMTVLCEATPDGQGGRSGNIAVSGNPALAPRLGDLLFAADRDIEIAGNPDQGYDGFIAAHEAIKFNGNPYLKGAAVAEGAPDTPGSPLPDNTVSGNARITYNGDLSVPLSAVVRITAWNEL